MSEPHTCPTCGREIPAGYRRSRLLLGTVQGIGSPQSWCVYCEGEYNREQVDRFSKPKEGSE